MEIDNLTVRRISEPTLWDAIVGRLGDSDLRQSYAWGELQRESGWRPYRCAVFAGTGGDEPVAAVSILARTLPYVRRSLLYAPRAPLLDWKDEEVWPHLKDAMVGVAKDERAVALRVSPGVHAFDTVPRETLLRHGFIALPDDWTTWNTPRIIMSIDLRPKEEELRRNVRKGISQYFGRLAKGGGCIETTSSAEAVEGFHALLMSVGMRKGLPVKPVEYFHGICRAFAPDDRLLLALARGGKSVLAGIIAVRFGRRAYLLYAGVDTESESSRRLHPGPSLYWELIRWAKTAGCESLDLGGSGTNFPPREDDPGYGVYRYKEGFGASLGYLTGYYDLVFNEPMYKAFRLAERRLLPLAWSVRSKFNRRSHETAPAAATVVTQPNGQPLNILFLGNSHHELSVACLLATVRSGHHVIVGGFPSAANGLWPTIKATFRMRGVVFVLKKGVQRVLSALRVLARHLRLPVSGYASRTEVLRAHGVASIPCHNPNSPEFVEAVRKLGIDLIVVAGFNRVLKPAIIGTPRLGCINVHPSMLPKYRGPEPYYWVLANGETKTGVTVHYIDSGIDSGNIISQAEVSIVPGEAESSLRQRLADKAAEQLHRALTLIAAGKAPSIPQDETQATYFSFRPKGARTP